MAAFVFEREQRIPGTVEEVFPFFADAANLERITPPELRFRIVTPTPIEMRPGALIDYRLSLFGVPFRWRTRIDSFVPNESFVDVQLRGPYKSWRHTHTFEAAPHRTTLMRDRIVYEVPFGPAGALARSLFVARQIERIFDYRRGVIDRSFRATAANGARAASLNT